MVSFFLDSSKIDFFLQRLCSYSCKSQLWKHIKYVCSLDPFLLRILASDFNEILNLEEKSGCVARIDQFSILLNDNIERSNIIDVEPNNGMFTWNNRRSERDAISERLDIFIVFGYWIRDKWK